METRILEIQDGEDVNVLRRPDLESRRLTKFGVNDYFQASLVLVVMRKVIKKYFKRLILYLEYNQFIIRGTTK